jgi:hypothetical protein
LTFDQYGCLSACFVNRFLFVHYSFFLSEQTQARFVFSSVQAQGTNAKDNLCVEPKKVKLKVILKVEAYKIFVLCSKEIMQQSLGKEKRNLKRGFFVLCFRERSNIEAWEFRKNLGRKLKEKTSKVNCRFNLVLAIIHGCVLLGSIGVCGHDFLDFVGVPSHCSPWFCLCW